MRQRSIHSIAHWTIMTLLLLFPVLMVGVSSFAQDSQEVTVTETYQYETNEVNTVDDLVEGNIYKYSFTTNGTGEFSGFDDICAFNLVNHNLLFILTYNSTYLDYSRFTFTSFDNIDYYSLNVTVDDNRYTYFIEFDDVNDDTAGAVSVTNVTSSTITLEFYLIYVNASETFSGIDYISASDYLGEKTTDVQITNANYKQDINSWCNEFINLPVNGWYQSLMNVMGIGLTNNSVMNVIYVMPLYIIWVFILDLVVDIILVIVRLPHKALNKLGGENE